MTFSQNNSFVFVLSFFKLSLLCQSCTPSTNESFDVFYIDIAAMVNETYALQDQSDLNSLVELFNNSTFVYYYSENKEKLVHQLKIGDQYFRSTIVFHEGRLGVYQFVEYLGNSFLIKKTTDLKPAVKGIDWDLIEIKSKKKQILDFDCKFVEGFSIIDGVDFTISGYICPVIRSNLPYVQSSEIMDVQGIWAFANVSVDGLELQYKIVKHERMGVEDVVFPITEDFDLIEYDPTFTEGFTKWLQN